MENQILKKGYVEKQSKYIKRYRKRYLVLKGHFLYSYKDSYMNDDPTEIFNLCEYNQYFAVNDDNEDIGYLKAMQDNTLLKFKISSKSNSRFFVTNSYSDLCEWLSVLEDITFKSYQFTVYVKIDEIIQCDHSTVHKFNFKVDVKNDEIVKCDHSTEFKKVLDKAIQTYGTRCISECSLELTLQMGYLEKKPIWDLHNKGLHMQLMQKPLKQSRIQNTNKNCADNRLKRKQSAYDEFAKNKEQLYSFQNITDIEEKKSHNTVLVTINVINNKEMNCKLMVPHNGRQWPFSCFDNYDVVKKMNDLYRPTRFKVRGLNQANAIDLEVDSVTHKVGSKNITCKYMLNHMDENKSNVLKCPIYQSMK
eukprot:233981_1